MQEIAILELFSPIAGKGIRRLLLPLLLLIAITCSCNDLSQREREQVSEALSDSLLNTTESWDVSLTIIDKRYRSVRITGSKAQNITESRDDMTIISGPVFVEVFDTTGAVSTRLRCGHAKYFSEAGSFEFYEEVRVKTSEQKRLRSSYLEWSQQSDMISTPEFVIITTPTDSIAGYGFEGTTTLSNYQIQEVSGEVSES